MGREIRRVPANWEHPKKEYPDYATRVMVVRYQPMRNQPYEPALREWITEWEAWDRGDKPDYCSKESKSMKFWEYSGPPPDPQYYRPDWDMATATWLQVYETVSEGTPVSPPFATPEEIVDYLVANGDFWDQKRRAEGVSFMDCRPWAREQAEAFVKQGWAPSLIVDNGVVMTGVEALTKQEQPK